MRVLVSLVVGGLALVPAAPTMPELLETYLTKYVRLEADARARLVAGQTVTKQLEADPAKEVAVFGAVWVNAPIEKYLAAVRDIERFESGGSFRITRKISAPPRREDFAELRLPAEDIADLRSCRVSSCDLKLAESAIDRMRREVDWSKPDVEARVNAIARDMAFDYVTSYLQGGNEQLAVYRDSSRPTFVANELTGMVDRLQALSEFLPGIRRYLMEFPRATLPDSESFLYWQEVKFGLKPTIRINHLVIARDPSGATVASKMLYATHYFWTALELRVLVRDPARGSGFWFITESRSRSDGLSGFVGRVIRGKVRGEAEKGVATVLETTKENMERR
jgi:hypothetical protein